ncbi:MAG: hypothetical protein ACTMHL_10895 [Janibacter sp.]
MPPSHPRPEDLTALSAALSATGDDCSVADEELLDHMVTVGDHATQAALEGVVDDAVDALRELSATCRELTLALGPLGAAESPRTAPATATAREHR